MPLSALGLVVACAATLAHFAFAVPRVDYVVQLVASSSVALVVVGIAIVSLASWLTHRALAARSKTLHDAMEADRRESDPRFVEAGCEWETGFSLARLAWFPLAEIAWTWTSPDGFRVRCIVRDGACHEVVASRVRAWTREIVRRVRVEDGLGLSRVVLERREPRAICVLPSRGKLGPNELSRALSAGDWLEHPSGVPEGDRVDMRRYVPGDPLRLVLWKTYARTGELMVRTPERALSPAPRAAAYLPAAFGDEAAAAAARVAIEDGLLGSGWIFSADGANERSSDVRRALELVAASSVARGLDVGDAAGLDAYVRGLPQTEPIRLVIFVPGVAGLWLERVVRCLRTRTTPALVVIGIDGIRERSVRRPIDRVLRRASVDDGGEDAATTDDMFSEIVRTLVATGSEVHAVDRVSGRFIEGSARGVVAREGAGTSLRDRENRKVAP